MASKFDIFARLTTVIEQRRGDDSGNSYTRQLFERGDAAIGAKVLEEAQELAEAAAPADEYAKQRSIHEAADLLYHTMVLLAARGLSLHEVAAELERREGKSGLAEKATRDANSQ